LGASKAHRVDRARRLRRWLLERQESTTAGPRASPEKAKTSGLVAPLVSFFTREICTANPRNLLDLLSRQIKTQPIDNLFDIFRYFITIVSSNLGKNSPCLAMKDGMKFRSQFITVRESGACATTLS